MNMRPPRPTPPPIPDPADCCESGCEVCIFDVYTELLNEYRAALAEWEALGHEPPASTDPKNA